MRSLASTLFFFNDVNRDRVSKEISCHIVARLKGAKEAISSCGQAELILEAVLAIQSKHIESFLS